MDTRTKSIIAVIAVGTLASVTVAIVAGFIVLILVLHDGQQTSDLVNKLMDLATAGAVAMAYLLGINHQASASTANTSDVQANAPDKNNG